MQTLGGFERNRKIFVADCLEKYATPYSYFCKKHVKFRKARGKPAELLCLADIMTSSKTHDFGNSFPEKILTMPLITRSTKFFFQSS